MAPGLDEPVRRYFRHAIADGASLGAAVALRMEGRIRAGRWLPFTATERLGRDSFAWRARVGAGPLTLLRVVDRYADGAGETRMRLLGAIPLPATTGPDVTRSAAGRAALEAALFAPGCVLVGEGVAWRAEADDLIVGAIEVGPERTEVHVSIDDRGAVRSVWALRWGDPGRQGHAYVPFGCEVHEEARFGGLTIPSRLSAGWWFGTPRYAPFFEARITGVAVLGDAPPAAATRRRADATRDILQGIAGAGRMAASFLAPHRRARRNRWGLGEADAARTLPGDELVPTPRWSWTHAIEVDAPPERVWPWVAQVGADRGGFYSYQWLENLVGCEVENADEIHPEWELHEGDDLLLHPKQPPLKVVEVVPGRHLVAHGPPDEAARAAGEPWVAATWLFLVEPLGEGRSRVISRYRCATSDHRATRTLFGPALIEPIGFSMDRRMLLGIKERAEA
jgi:hypothetical protein